MVEIGVVNGQAWALQRIAANFYLGRFIRCPINLLKNVQSVLLSPRVLKEDEEVRPEQDPKRWMDAIIPARCMMEQNVEMLRAPDGGIELRSTKEIGAREELRVWCSSYLGDELGIYKVRDEDKQEALWLCQRCKGKFRFPNLLSAHVTFTCNRNDVIKETMTSSANDVELQTERQRLITGGEGQRHRKPIESYQDEESDVMLVETPRETRDVQQRQRPDNRVGPASGVRYIARPSARDFSFYGAYGLSTMLAAQRNQRLLNNPRIARLISSFARPRLPKLINEPESLAEHQKKEFRKKFQGNEHYLRRHLYRDGGCDAADDIDKFEEMLKLASSVDEEGNDAQQLKDDKEEVPHNEDTGSKTAARDSNAKYGPFYSSDEFHLAFHYQAKVLNKDSIESTRFLQPFCRSIFNATRGVCQSDFPGNDHVILRCGAHGMAGKCTCGNHNNTTFPGISDEETLGESRGRSENEILNLSKREKRNETPGNNLSTAAVDSNKNAPNYCASSMPSFHGNRHRLDAVLKTPPTLSYKQPTFDHCYINAISRLSFQHPEPALYLDPFRYSPYQRMLPGTPSQSSAQAQARAQGFRCEYCGKAYCRKYVLKIHMRTHTGFKPLQCKVCDKTFSDPSNMKKHVKLHETEDMVHQCAHCGRNFVRYRGLLNHLKSKHDKLP